MLIYRLLDCRRSSTWRQWSATVGVCLWFPGRSEWWSAPPVLPSASWLWAISHTVLRRVTSVTEGTTKHSILCENRIVQVAVFGREVCKLVGSQGSSESLVIDVYSWPLILHSTTLYVFPVCDQLKVPCTITGHDDSLQSVPGLHPCVQVRYRLIESWWMSAYSQVTGDI